MHVTVTYQWVMTLLTRPNATRPRLSDLFTCVTCRDRGRVLVDDSPSMRFAVREGLDRECDWTACPDCHRCEGCQATAEHEVDGEHYCDMCAAALVVMAQRYTGELPRICDTERPDFEVAS